MLAMRYHGTEPWYKDCGVQGYKYRTKIWFPLTKVHHRVQHWREIRAPRMNIILSSGHSPARHLDNGKRRGNSKHSWRSPPRDAERREEISAREVEKWHTHGTWMKNMKQSLIDLLKIEAVVQRRQVTRMKKHQIAGVPPSDKDVKTKLN